MTPEAQVKLLREAATNHISKCCECCAVCDELRAALAATAEPVKPTLAERFEQVDSRVPVTEEEAREVLQEAGVDPSKNLARLMGKLDEPEKCEECKHMEWCEGCPRPSTPCTCGREKAEPSPAPRDAEREAESLRLFKAYTYGFTQGREYESIDVLEAMRTVGDFDDRRDAFLAALLLVKQP